MGMHQQQAIDFCMCAKAPAALLADENLMLAEITADAYDGKHLTRACCLLQMLAQQPSPQMARYGLGGMGHRAPWAMATR